MRKISTPLILGLGTFVALLGAALAVDNAFRLHMSVLVLVLGTATIYTLRRVNFASEETLDTSGYMDGPIRVGSVLTMFWGIIGFTMGVLIASQLA